MVPEKQYPAPETYSGCLLESMIQRLNPLQLHPYQAQVIRHHQVSWKLISLEKQVYHWTVKIDV